SESRTSGQDDLLENIKSEKDDIPETVISEKSAVSKNSTSRNTGSSDKNTSKKNIISKDEAKNIALKKAGGKVEEIELEKENNKLIYEIEVENGQYEYEFRIDAVTGKILSMERDQD